MTILTDIFSPTIRKRLYFAYALVGLVVGAVQVGYSAAGQGQPTWLTVTLAVVAFLGTALGLTAASNTGPSTQTASAPSAAAGSAPAETA